MRIRGLRMRGGGGGHGGSPCEGEKPMRGKLLEPLSARGSVEGELLQKWVKVSNAGAGDGFEPRRHEGTKGWAWGVKTACFEEDSGRFFLGGAELLEESADALLKSGENPEDSGVRRKRTQVLGGRH